jgi:hypothetical protein
VHGFLIFPALAPVVPSADQGAIAFPQQHEATVFSIVWQCPNGLPWDVFRCNHAELSSYGSSVGCYLRINTATALLRIEFMILRFCSLWLNK